MGEATTAQAGTNETQSTESTEAKTFTQDDVNKIVQERVAKEKAKYEGFEEMKSKAAEYERLQEANKSDLQKAEDKASKLEKELAGYKKAEQMRQIKASVSEKTGIPERLLTGETEEACEAQANAIKEYVAEQIEEARNNGYPILRDAGEVHPASRKQSTDEQFAEWMKKVMK